MTRGRLIEVISSDNPKNSRGRGKKPNKHVGRKSRNAEQTFTVQQDFTAASRVPQGRHRRTRSVVEPDSVQVAPVYQKAPIPTFVTEEETDTLRIDNLQRPFSLNALMELLTSHGGPLEEPHTVEVDGQEVVRDPVWLDAIKTHAYATFRDASHAKKAMESLQGMQWPAASPKHLLIRFSSRSAFDRTDDIQKHEQEEEQRALDFATRTKEVEITAVEKPAESSGGLVVKKRIELASNIRFEVALDSPTKSTLHEAEAKIKDESYSPRSKSKVFYPTAEEQLSRANERAVEYNKSVGSEALLARPIFRQKGFIDGNHEFPLGLDVNFRRTLAAPRLYWQTLSEEMVEERLPSIRKSREDDEIEYAKYLEEHRFDKYSSPRYGHSRSRSRSPYTHSQSRSPVRSRRRSFSRSRSPRRFPAQPYSPRSRSPSPSKWANPQDGPVRNYYPQDGDRFPPNYSAREGYPPRTGDRESGPAVKSPGGSYPGWGAESYPAPPSLVPQSLDNRPFPPPPLLPQATMNGPGGQFIPYNHR